MTSRLPVLLFDDRHDSVVLSPLTDLRASFLVRTGALTTLERLQHDERVRVVGVVVGHDAADLTREQCRLPVNEPPTDVASVLLVNGRCPLLPEAALRLGVGEALVEGSTSHLVAARVAPGDVRKVLDAKTLTPAQVCDGRVLLARPWHVRSFRDACLSHDLNLIARVIAGVGTRLPAPAVAVGDRPVVIAHTSTVLPGVVLDAEHGAIVIDEHAVIRPGAILIGPCYVGPHSTVLERATIRPGTAIGPWCKVNGEVGGTIFQGFANKAHDGYLGDSWVGEWVNLGAGTTNSNLLNTYAETIARATLGGKHERTGEQFLGAVIGDHVKTAICTRIMTASILGTGGMHATTEPVSGTTERFTWATDEGTRSYRADKFLEVMQAAMARRKVHPSPAYVSRVRALLGAG